MRASRIVGSLAAGYVLYASFPPRPLWFLAPFAFAALVWVLRSGPSLRGGFGYGLLAGLGFFVPLLPWVGVYVGALPWLALAAGSALYVGAFGVLARIVARLPFATIWIATVWSLTEWARSSFPFGGFPWGRLAFGQSDGFLRALASLGGAPFLSFGIALTGCGIAALVRALVDRDTRRDVRLIAGSLAAAVLMPVVAAITWTTLPGMDSGDRYVTVAAIQGSVPQLGLDFNAQRRAVLDNHVRRTFELARDIAAGRVAKPDVVIWPENSSDVDPLRNPDASDEITEASEAVGAPILVGAVLVNDDGTTTNSVIVWNGADGPGERHDKKIIQPFGEYLPWRSFFRHFSAYADRAGHFVPGHGNGTVHAAGIDIGVATCYEVAFDRALEESVRNGAQLLAVPTNNATFGDTEMTYQQLAMSRIRAVEHGRALVVAATSGVSAIISPNGAVEEQTPLFVPAAMVMRLPLRSESTLATTLGPVPELTLCAIGVAATLAGLWLRRRHAA
ncbi:apolipoprotein N-acyltransferase [Skermania sp. ID1734]|uniref:apolipoprotein N-acyltransferase n=1 Tax=Skermania sp. ID1734 TaxID=2597516 RepID=UPI00117D4ACF|nr:apolipoprotein N-acyltransferase [Skermania sp. ID1734]TSE01622.1 apolipoprotein N-acyltransferase [Skermania sp. ID1734]